jgi:catechol 2,3-dioxygenase-like lactoylglutathione lyase family enzyme
VTIQRMDHFTIVTDRLQETLDFYQMLGLCAGARPNFTVPGSWLYIGTHATLHVVVVEKMPNPRRGVLDHMAFWADGLVAIAARLRAQGVCYRLGRAPAPNRIWQLFFEDPNGAEVELDFHPAEKPPDDWKTSSGLPGLVDSNPQS